MDKALACHTGGLGLNLDTTKFYCAPIFSRTPAMCTLSHNACCHMLQHEYLSQGRYKESNHCKSISRAICKAKHSYKSDVWEKGGKNQFYLEPPFCRRT